MAFIKNKEDFICEHCKSEVVGDGFTNHCPKCLYSKHVDISPGDRAAKCGGMMKPINFSKEGDGYVFTHECEICGHEKRNKMSPNDDFDLAVGIVSQQI